MTRHSLVDSDVESTALAWLSGLGSCVLGSPDIASGELAWEREDCRQDFLEGRLMEVLKGE